MPNTMNQTHTRVFLKRLKLCQLCHREIVRTFSFICGLWYRIYCRGLLHDHKSAKSNILWQKQLMNNYFWGKLWLIVGGWYVLGDKGRLPLPKRMNFRKSSKRQLTPPLIFRKVVLQIFSEIHDRSIVYNGKNLQYKFLDWKWPPPLWNFSENSSVLEGECVPKGGIFDKGFLHFTQTGCRHVVHICFCPNRHFWKHCHSCWKYCFCWLWFSNILSSSSYLSVTPEK